MNITLPYPPSVNTYWRMFRGHMAISTKGREYRGLVWQIMKALHVEGFGSKRLNVEITAHMPDRRRRDLDNTAKAILDSLQHAALFDDDEQIDVLTIRRADVCPPGRVELLIEEAV